MPKLTEIQSIALEIVDYLYFYDIASLETFSEEKKQIYIALLRAIDHILLERNLSNDRYEIYKHYLLCGVEIVTTQYTSPNIRIGEVEEGLSKEEKEKAYKKINQDRLKIAFQALLREVQSSGYDSDYFGEDVTQVIILSSIDEASDSVSFRLVAQVLWSEFEGCIAAHVYRKFLNLKILSTAKSTSKNYYDEIGNKFLFLRALLFIEFEILRQKLFLEYDLKGLNQPAPLKNISNSLGIKRAGYYRKYSSLLYGADFNSVCNCDLTIAKQVKKYLYEFYPSFSHNQIFTNRDKWVTLLGVWELMYEKKTNLEKSIYSNTNNEGTCSDVASILMKERYGLIISARNLALHYNKAHDLYAFIREFFMSIEEEVQVGFMSLDISSNFYYNPNMSEKINSLLDDLIKMKD